MGVRVVWVRRVVDGANFVGVPPQPRWVVWQEFEIGLSDEKLFETISFIVSQIKKDFPFIPMANTPSTFVFMIKYRAAPGGCGSDSGRVY
jgi:hypothetical protein